MRRMLLSVLLLMLLLLPGLARAQQQKIKVIVFGAHPDDCEVGAGGLAALYAQQGHLVKFVSMTNGDKGHYKLSGQELAHIRLGESKEVARRIGIAYDVLENADGELMPDLKNRLEVIRLIREWKADIVVSHRPYAYHPDHRYTGTLVQDAAFLVTVPNILSSVAPLAENPLFLYFSDPFKKPYPFELHLAIDITPVKDKKLEMLDAHASQFYEWLPWLEGRKVPDGNRDAKKKWLAAWRVAPSEITAHVSEVLTKWYGAGRLHKVTHVEAFEICEYGRKVGDKDLKVLFPMFSD